MTRGRSNPEIGFYYREIQRRRPRQATGKRTGGNKGISRRDKVRKLFKDREESYWRGEPDYKGVKRHRGDTRPI